MKKTLFLITALVLTVSGTAYSGERPSTIEEFYEPGSNVRVIAHRGFSGRAPENTLAAIREAVAVGADMAEIDVTLSSDGEIVVIHDETLERTTNGSGPAAQLDLAALRRLDAGSWFDPEFAGERIPTLEEVLTTVRGEILLNIEIKSEAVVRGIAAKVVAAVQRFDMGNQVVISSFSLTALEQVHSQAGDMTTAVLFDPEQAHGRGAVDIVIDVGASVFNIERTRLTSTMLERCSTHGIPVGVYTVNKKRHMRRMIEKGVVAIFTDRPDRLIEVLQKHAPPAPTLKPVTASP